METRGLADYPLHFLRKGGRGVMAWGLELRHSETQKPPVSVLEQPLCAGQDLGKCDLRESPYTHFHLPNPVNQLQRDFLGSGKPEENPCLLSIAWAILPCHSPKFYIRDQLREAIASLNFQALLYLLNSFSQQHMLSGVYCMPGILQGLRAGNVPAHVFW